MEYFHTYTPSIYKGKHTGQQGPASLPCRLRSVDHHWDRNSRHPWSLSGVVDLERLTHVVHWWGDPPLDESRAPRSGEVWNAGIRRESADQAVRLLRSRDGYLRSVYHANKPTVANS